MNLMDLISQMPDPNRVAAGMGQMPAPNFNRVKGPGLLDRLMPSTGMEGLLGPGDIKNAQGQGLLGIGAALSAAAGPRRAEDRVPLMAAIAQGLQGGQNAYQQAAASTAALRGASRKAQSEQMELDKAKQREAIFKALPPPKAGASNQETQQWMTAVMPHLINAGLLEDATQIAQAKKAMEHDKPQTVQTGNLVTTFDPEANNGQGGIWDPEKQTYVPSIERGLPQDTIDLKMQAMKATADAAAARLDAARATTNNNRMDRLATTWDKHVKPMTDRVQPINQALMALDAARTDPTVGGNALIAVMSAVDPKATQRYQMVQWVNSHLTPSVAATARRYLLGKTTGLLPPELIDALSAHVKRTRQTIIEQEGRTYNEYIKMHPEMRDQLPRIDTSFAPDPEGSSAPNARPPLSSFGQ